MKSLAKHGLRLAICAGLGVVVGAAARLATPMEAATALGWDAAALGYMGHIWASLLPASAEDIRSWSGEEDEGRSAITLIMTGVVAASLFAIFDLLANTPNGWTIALAAGTILCSWTLLHSVFAVHYAHRCFTGDKGPDRRQAPGLDFPGEEPRFSDFAYYSFTIGMTFQTSDVDTTTGEMRRLTLVHGVVSFAFNTVIIAISVGIASGLLAG